MIETLRKYFDYIIVDTAPIGVVIDAAIIVQKCDASILVTEASANKNGEKFQKSQRSVRANRNTILGVILNKFNIQLGKIWFIWFIRELRFLREEISKKKRE